jgi:4-amino-4-deoxy-L-arabinose transferase-like glycosyltransferase
VGFALAGGLGIALMTRLRRSDLRTGWIVATGGAFLACAVAFSYAKGIFHPYYVSLLAPFTAALVGGTVGLLRSRSFAPHLVLPAAVIGGVAGELAVLRNVSGFDGLDTVITVVGVGCALALALLEPRRLRAGVLALALGVLLIAPASWSVQTLGHPTNGTFPAGGPAASGFAGGPPGGGGMFGGETGSLSAASAYAKAHGGGAVVIASQSGAAGSIVATGADVAGIGGFSGRESTISISWLAQQVAAGRVRWVLVGSGGAGGMPNDARQGSTAALDAVARTCKRVAGSTGSGTLYDCAGAAARLAAAAA